MDELYIKPIATIKTDFKSKFGIPRQSRIVNSLKGIITFLPEFNNMDAVRGLENSTHIWLLWGFSENIRENWKPTVRPPRLGGNKRLGVFATRSPFRPNPIGLSAVELEKIEFANNEIRLHVKGADLMNGTPIYDIKPYITYTDSIEYAKNPLFESQDKTIEVEIDKEQIDKIKEEDRETLIDILRQNPTPAYKKGGDESYKFEFGDYHITYTFDGKSINVIEIDDSLDKQKNKGSLPQFHQK